ncbi:MAG: hypothetical protein RLZZ387_5178 [Chloroflexota bacterium]|jgi:GT2 family glycosyltransferase
MTVSIIIPNLHSPLIGAVLDALRAQTAVNRIREIVVVGLDRHGQVRPDALVRMIDTGRPVSAPTARNRGAAETTGEHLLFVDADCVLAPDAVGLMLDAAEQGYAALVGGVVPDDEQYWVHASNLMTFPEYLTLDAPGERGSLPSFCMLVARDALEKVGGFDESYHPTAEDLDLCFRLRRLGYRLGCEPRAAVRHRSTRATPGAVWRQHIQYGWGYYRIQHSYPDIVGSSEAVWVADHMPRLLPPLAVPIAVAFVMRLLLRRPAMRRFWRAVPGMIWTRLAWYEGFRMAAQTARGAR